jgi:predicted ATPase
VPATARAPRLDRERELTQLGAVLDELAAGGPPAVVVEGEPGIGKTRLLAELAERVRARGGRVLSGRAAEYETTLPFAAFVDALDDHVAAAAGLPDDDRAELASVLPSLEATAGSTRLVDERHRLHAAMRRLYARWPATASCSSRSTTCTGPTPRPLT